MADHDVIWLAPDCPRDQCEHQTLVDAGDGRLWCQDDVWGKCHACGIRAIRYIRDDRAPSGVPFGNPAFPVTVTGGM